MSNPGPDTRPEVGPEVQEGRPSEVDPIEAREGLAWQWVLAGLVPIAIAVAIVLVKLV